MRQLPASTLEARRERVLSFVNALPEASVVQGGVGHFSFNVGGRIFGYFLDNHHGDGRVALNCKGADDANKTLARVVPDRFFVPKYVGARGWLGLWLDLPKIDWTQAEDVIKEGYRLAAPRNLWEKLNNT